VKRSALVLLLAAALSTTSLTPAKAEPISIFIGLTALLEGTALAGLGGSIVGGILSIGLSFAAAALSHRGTGPLDFQQGSNLSDQQVSTRQSTPPKRIPYGTSFIGGALFFEKVKPPYLYRGYLISARKIKGLSGVFIGTNRLQFASFAPNTILTPLGIVGQPDYPNRLQVSIRHGEDDQAIDPLLAADFTSLDASFRQRGIATVVLRYHYGTDDDEHRSLWGTSGRANTYFLVDGVSVYDPRDPTQDRDDESTWKFSRNATLVQTDYLRQNYGGRINADKIDFDKIV